MATALVVPCSGPSIGTWDALPIGTCNDDGYELSCVLQGQEVNETDAYGMTLVEAIYRGQNWRCRLRGLEWDTGLLAILQMFGSLDPTFIDVSPFLDNIGDRWSKFCAALVLTAILGDPPTTPQSLTAVNSGFAPNSQSAFLMTSKVRELPLELIFLPYSVTIDSQTTHVPFTTT